MFMLKSMFTRVWGDPNTTELASISSGELYIVRPRSSPKGARECIFQKAGASVRRTDREFNYQLVITRVYDEGEETVLDEDDETDEEFSFLIGEELEFRASNFDGRPTFVWSDVADGGDPEDLFEFQAGGDDASRAIFETSVLKAIYERKYSKSSEKARDSDLKKLMYQPPERPNAKPSPAPSQSAAASSSANRAPASEPASSSRPKSPAVPAPDRERVYSEQADLLMFDRAADAFALQTTVNAHITVNPKRRFDYYLDCDEEGYPWLSHEITEDMNCKWNKKYVSFRWNHFRDNGELTAWCLQFVDDDTYEKFREKFNHCQWEAVNGMPWSKAKKEDSDYAQLVYDDQDVEMVDVENFEDNEEDAVEDALQSLSEDDGDQAQEEDEDTREFYAKTSGQEVNTGLAVGYTGERTFVTRGSRIGVFKHNDDSADRSVRHAGTINKVTTLAGKVFSPNKAMLHERDHTMVLSNPNDAHHLYKMDLTVGKVVEEWKVHDDIPVRQINPASKFAPTTDEQTLLGTSDNSLFTIDPRVSGDKIVQSKTYATKAAFSSLTTTKAGHIAVASHKGDIRLFDTVGKIAKTALPALGDPIIGLDVTASGAWVVATCKTKLYVIHTQVNENQTGFQKAFAANAKPSPKVLQLKPEHVMYMGNAVSFTPAKFDIGPDLSETSIVTSSGNYVIAWDFEKIKQGILDKYEIKQYDDNVVQDEFRFANQRDIVVALKNNVLMVDKKKLRKPTRKSLGRNVRSSSPR